jgi:hypothetical protein
VISSVNSGAYSGNDFMYSVGEIYVESDTDPDQNNSGLMGILYQVEFNVTGLESILASDDLRAYPNPTSQSVFVDFNSTHKIEIIYVLDNMGKVVQSTALTDQAIDFSLLPDGVYFIKTNAPDIRTLKIIKQ